MEREKGGGEPGWSGAPIFITRHTSQTKPQEQKCITANTTASTKRQTYLILGSAVGG